MDLLFFLLRALSFLVIADAILSWIQPDPSQPPRRYTAQLMEPLYRPIRKVLPTAGGFDFSPIVLLILIEVVTRLLASALM